MNDILDPAEIAAQAATRGDTGEIGSRFQWRDTPLTPYSLHHKNAHYRMAWDNMTDQEYAQTFLWLLATKKGVEANLIRGEKAVSQAQFEAIEWAQKQGAMNKITAGEMVEKMKEVRADAEAADSLQPVSRGGSSGNV